MRQALKTLALGAALAAGGEYTLGAHGPATAAHVATSTEDYRALDTKDKTDISKKIEALVQDLDACKSFEELNRKHDQLEALAAQILDDVPEKYKKDFGYISNMITHPKETALFGVSFIALWYLARAMGKSKREAAEAAADAVTDAGSTDPDTQSRLQRLRALIPNIDWSKVTGFPKQIWETLNKLRGNQVDETSSATHDAVDAVITEEEKARQKLEAMLKANPHIATFRVYSIVEDEAHVEIIFKSQNVYDGFIKWTDSAWRITAGTLTFPDGRVEKGTFDANTQNLTEGERTWPNGVVEKGTFDATGRLMEGKATFPNGVVAEGTFDANFGRLMEGTKTSSDGVVYKGTFDANSGVLMEGTKTYSDGVVYKGTFDANSGVLMEGTQAYPDGKTTTVRNGKIV